jgi:hypothetical protein
MDFDHPGALYSSILIGLLGTGLFLYGKKQASIRCLLAGVGLCVFPYFVTSVLLMWGITTATLAALFFTREQ